MHPLTDRDAREMLEQIRCTKVLCGYRGKPAADANVLRESILRLFTLVSVCPEIREIDLNPLKVLEHRVRLPMRAFASSGS